MNTITVTSPLLPDLNEFHALLSEIWNSKWITNNGSFHKRLEEALAEYLKVPYVSLFTNGTLRWLGHHYSIFFCRYDPFALVERDKACLR